MESPQFDAYAWKPLKECTPRYLIGVHFMKFIINAYLDWTFPSFALFFSLSAHITSKSLANVSYSSDLPQLSTGLSYQNAPLDISANLCLNVTSRPPRHML